MLGMCADWASEPPASVAQPERIGAWHPQRPVHALLGVFIESFYGIIGGVGVLFFV
jgi:hypothetical protein